MTNLARFAESSFVRFLYSPDQATVVEILRCLSSIVRSTASTTAREIHDGRVVPALDSPGRAESILNRLRDARLGPIVEPGEFGDEPLFRACLAIPHFLANSLQPPVP